MTLFPSMLLPDGATLAAASLILVLAGLIQGTVGFGLGMIAVPLLALVEPRLVPGPIMVVIIIVTGLGYWRERGFAVLGDIPWAFLGRLPGLVLGAWALAVLDARATALTLGGLILLAVAMSAGGWRLRRNRPTLLVAGFASGFMGTFTAIGGPPILLLYQQSRAAALRATLSAFFLVGSITSAVALAAVGRLGAEELSAGLLLLPGGVAGLWLSNGAIGLFRDRWVSPAALGLATAAALLVIGRAW